MACEKLSLREREVLDLVVEGRTNKEIALALCIEPGTVGDHLGAILQKMEASNRTSAAVAYVRAHQDLGREQVASAARAVGDDTLDAVVQANRGLSRLVIGREQIYDEGARLCWEACKSIRSIVFGGSGGKAPESWAEAVCGRLTQNRSNVQPTRFTPILAVDLDAVPDGFEERVRERLAFYSARSVGDLVDVSLLPTDRTGAVDVLIVDEVHAVIGMGTNRRDDDLHFALLFEDQPDVAERLYAWWTIRREEAVPLNQWSRIRSRSTHAMDAKAIRENEPGGTRH